MKNENPLKALRGLLSDQISHYQYLAIEAKKKASDPFAAPEMRFHFIRRAQVYDEILHPLFELQEWAEEQPLTEEK